MSVDLTYLIPLLRLKIGDIDVATQRYVDSWLLVALSASIGTLASWWNFKYTVDSNNLVSRSGDADNYITTEPPTIEPQDEMSIVLMAGIITTGGALRNSSWNLASWRDAEISYTNLQSGAIGKDLLAELWTELLGLMTPPTKRLASPMKQSLPGYKYNIWENGIIKY
jgi:hypothetical protein